MNHFRVILKKACDEMKDSFGSIDIVNTEGVEVLEHEGARWIEFGASNLSEICTSANDIKLMIADYVGYDDVKEQFMPDILATLDDLVYHSSIFNIYYNSALKRFSETSTIKQQLDYKEFENYIEKIDIDNIVGDWNIHLSDKRKREIVFKLTKLSFFICILCEKIENSPDRALELFDPLHYFAVKSMLLQKQLHYTD